MFYQALPHVLSSFYPCFIRFFLLAIDDSSGDDVRGAGVMNDARTAPHHLL